MVQSALLLQHPNIRHWFVGVTADDTVYQVSEDQVSFPEQVHGNGVVVAQTSGVGYRGVDGLVLSQKGVLSVRTADCLPVLFYSPERSVVSAVHAGWRGLSGNILSKTVALLQESGAAPGSLIVAIGPHIRQCCYPVSSDLIDQFVKSGLVASDIAKQQGKQWLLDLENIALRQLMESGVSEKNIDILPVCTSCDQGFASYRRGLGTTARNMSYIELV